MKRRVPLGWMVTIHTGKICPGLNANEVQIPQDKHHKVSSLVKSHQNAHYSVKYEVTSKNMTY